MTQEQFRQRHAASWERLETMIAVSAGGKRNRLVSASDVVDLADFDREYRRVCKHLALARQRRYGTDLVGFLNELALRANREFYGRRRSYLPSIAAFLFVGFPALVRANGGLVLVATALFVLPAVAANVALRIDPDLVHQLMDAEQLRQMEEMYEPGARYRTPERAADDDLQMFGYYIANNIGIGLRTFAGGILFGVGSVFFVALNGAYLGLVGTHLDRIGYGETFFPFVAGHSAPELIAIVLCGAAGLGLGWSVIAPGRRSRADALRRAAADGVQIVIGAACMLLLAACIEAFWSPRESVPDAIRIAVGLAIWAVTLLYFLAAGRADAS